MASRRAGQNLRSVVYYAIFHGGTGIKETVKKNNPIPPCTNNVGTKLIEPRFTESISFEVH